MEYNNSQSNPISAYLSEAMGSGADYFSAPYDYGGQQSSGRINAGDMQNLQSRLDGGMDYNAAVLQVLGDGLGTGSAGSTYDLGLGNFVGGGSASGRATGGASSFQSGGVNPYLTQAQQAIAGQVTDNLNRNILPGLSSAAMSSGNFGGSRQGVIEANAINDANRQIANGMVDMSFRSYESDANRGLQQQQISNSYDLGLGNLNNSFYTAQRGQDLQSTALGAQLMQQANQGYLGQGAGLANVGTQYQQAPWGTLGNYNAAITPYTGFGATSTVGQSANPWAQALGGAAFGAQVGNLFGGSSQPQMLNGNGFSNLPAMYAVG